MNRPPNERATLITQQLCEQVIHYNGTDRNDGEHIRRDADWQSVDLDSDPLRLRLIRQRGVGGLALYILHAESTIDRRRSTYLFDTLMGNLYQLHIQTDGNTFFHEWPSNSIDYLLRSAPTATSQPNPSSNA